MADPHLFAAGRGFSVIIPTHNRPRLVVACVESVLTQTYPPLEIIVVDDGSRPAAARALAPYEDRIKILCQRQAGWGAARLNGALHSRGDILAFLDDDCIAPPQWLACYAASYVAHPDAVGIGGGLQHDQHTNLAGLKLYRGHIDTFNRLNRDHHIQANQAGRVWFTYGGNRTFRRDSWLSAAMGGWSWYHDDLLIDLRLRERGAIIYYEPDAWVLHHYWLSLRDRLRSAYRYGRSEAQTTLPPDLPVTPAASHRSWRVLRREYPEISIWGTAWYAITQPLTWIARRLGQKRTK